MNEERLVSAILIQSAKDSTKGKYQTDVRGFTASPWFSVLARVVDVNSENVRNKLTTGNFDTATLLHMPYHGRR